MLRIISRGENSLGQTRVGIGVAVGAAYGHVVRGAVTRQPGVPVPGSRVDRRLFAVFFRTRDLAGETIANVAIHIERGPMICGKQISHKQ